MATCAGHLISELEVKDLTSMTGNVDIKKFVSSIAIMQDIHIKTAIGSACFDDLLDGVDNSNLTALETILLNGDARSFKGVKMALAWWVLYDSLPQLLIQITASGMGKKIGTGFESASVEEMKMVRAGALSKAEYYTDQLIGYIVKNIDDYPCYKLADVTLSPLSTDGYATSGIALDNDKIRRANPELRQIGEEGTNRSFNFPTT